MSCACSIEVFQATTCPLCGAAIPDAKVHFDGWVGFGIDHDAALAALQTPRGGLPSTAELAETLQRAWLLTHRADVRIDSSWVAQLKIKGEWTYRAGWIDRWFDEVPLATPQHEGMVATGVRGFGEPERLPILKIPLGDAVPWEPLLTEAIRIATGAEHALDVRAHLPPCEERRHVVLSPVWVAHAAGRSFMVHGETGVRIGSFEPDVSWARRWSGILVLLGLLLLTGSAALVLPGILIWPLLALTAIGSVLGYACLVAAGVPLARTRTAWRAP